MEERLPQWEWDQNTINQGVKGLFFFSVALRKQTAVTFDAFYSEKFNLLMPFQQWDKTDYNDLRENTRC